METYLKVLEFQAKDIENTDMDKFTAHSRMEAELIDRLQSLQRVILPLEESMEEGSMKGSAPANSAPANFDEHFHRQCETAVEKNRRNQEKIREELSRFRTQMEQLRHFSAKTGASYTGAYRRSDNPIYIDLEQ